MERKFQTALIKLKASIKSDPKSKFKKWLRIHPRYKSAEVQKYIKN